MAKNREILCKQHASREKMLTNVDMSTSCRHVHVRPHCFILIEACSCIDWNCPISREKYLKIDCSVKMPLRWLIMEVADS